MQASTSRRARFSDKLSFSLSILFASGRVGGKLRKVSVFLWHQHHMLGIKFNVKTPKCEFSEADFSCFDMSTHSKILRQKINETDINIRQRYTWEPNAFNCTFLTLFLAMLIRGWRVRETERERSTCSCRLQFFHLFHFSLFPKNSHTRKFHRNGFSQNFNRFCQICQMPQ